MPGFGMRALIWVNRPSSQTIDRDVRSPNSALGAVDQGPGDRVTERDDNGAASRRPVSKQLNVAPDFP
jgi:hypothetical protein